LDLSNLTQNLENPENLKNPENLVIAIRV